MKNNFQMSLLMIPLLLIVTATSNIFAQTIYIDCAKGDDKNPGTSDKPIKSFDAARILANDLTGEGSTIIKVAPGIYHLAHKMQFENKRKYSETDRFTIEATILPDDKAWTPAKMPVIISSAIPESNFGFDGAVGIDIEMDHVTIKGLKLLGNPQPEIYYYPIGRQAKTLSDLTVSQCLFVGDEDALPIQSGILAHGNQVIVDHCIFYHCKNSVVFYFADEKRDVPRQGSEMKHCLVYGAYESGVWTASPDKDFKFHNNIITKCKYAWIHNLLNRTVYSIENCVMTDNENDITKLDQNHEYVKSDIAYKKINVIDKGEIQLAKKDDIMIPVNYLHVVPGTLGSDLGAGLFIHVGGSADLINDSLYPEKARFNQALTAKGIVARCARAMGGEGAIKNLKTLRFHSLYPDHGTEPILFEIMRPNRCRNPRAQLIFDGKQACFLRGADGKSDQQMVESGELIDFEVEIGYFFPAFFDHPPEYLGAETWQGNENHKLRVILPLGAQMTYFVDAKTGLVSKSAATYAMNGKKFSFERIFSDYKSVDGFTFPYGFTYQGRKGGMNGRIEKIEFNVLFSSETFQIPALKK